MSKSHSVTELLRVTAGLTDLLEREAEMLLAMKPSQIQSLHEEKVALSKAYESQIKNLKSDPAVLLSIPADQRTDLRARIEKFQIAMLANQHNLHAARATTESALRAIADEVQAKTEKHAGYSANGAASMQGKANRTSAVAFAFDQCL